MQQKVLCGIAGPTCSGKTTFAKTLEHTIAEYCNEACFRIKGSDILIEEAKERDVPSDKTSLQTLYDELAEKHGEDVIPQRMLPIIRVRPEQCIIVEGMRMIDDLAMLRTLQQEGYYLHCVYIDADPRIRFERYNERLKRLGEPPIDFDAFKELESHTCEQELSLLKDEMLQHEGGTLIITDDAASKDRVRRIAEDVAHILMRQT